MIKIKDVCIGIILLLIMCMCGCSLSTESYNYEAALAKYNKGEYKEAKDYIDKVIKGNTDKAEHFILAGHIYIENSDMDNCIKYFDKAITDKKNIAALENNKEALRGKGVAYLRNKEYDKAIAELDKALAVEANDNLNKDITKYKIEATMCNNQVEEALKMTESYVDTYGKEDDLSIIQGKCYAYLKDEKQMLDKFNTIIKSGNKDGYYHLATAYEIIGNYDNAYANYELYLKGVSGAYKELVAIAMIECLIKAENFDKALELVNEYGKSEKSNYAKEFKIYNITLLEKQGNYNEAYNKAKEYTSTYPDDVAMAKEVSFLETRITQ